MLPPMTFESVNDVHLFTCFFSSTNGRECGSLATQLVLLTKIVYSRLAVKVSTFPIVIGIGTKTQLIVFQITQKIF